MKKENEEWEKVDKEILCLLNYLDRETAFYRNRPVEEFEHFPYPEFGRIHDAIRSLLLSQREKLVGEIEDEIERFEPAYEDVDKAYIDGLKFVLSLLRNK